jgi:predicted Zn-dependent peptidase
MQYKKTTLPNGLRIITVPTKGNQAVTVMVLVEAGSNYETKAQNGLSHFLEHMCFKGTTRRPTAHIIAKELDSLGAQSNAFTTNEFTGYYAKAEKKHFAKLLDVLSDMYLNPIFPVADLEKERGVILQEISMYEDLPQQKVWYTFQELLYGDTPAGRSIAGTKENIRSFSQKDFIDYRKAHYVANKTIVIVSGDIDQAIVKREIAKNFKDIPKGKSPKKLPVKEKQIKPAVLVERKTTDQMHLMLGFHAFKASDKRNIPLSVLIGVLGGGMSSRLFQKLREEMGVCYYVRPMSDSLTDHGLFAIATGVDPKRTEEVVKVLIAECKRLTTELVTEEELKKVKDYLAGTLYLNLETTDSLAEFYAVQEVEKGSLKSPKEYESALRAVKAKDIQKVAKDIFKNNKLNLAIIGNMKDEKALKKVLSF